MIFVSRTVADCIHSLQSDEVQNVNYKTFLAKVCEECKGGKFLAMQNFLIKTMCRRFGMDAFNILLENPVYKKCLVPPDLLPTKNKAKDNPYLHADSLALTGQVYIQTKDILLNITHSRDLTATFQQIVHQIQQSQDSIFQILLALSVWAVNSNVSVDLRREVFGTLTQKLHTHLTGRGDVPYFKDISNGVFEAFKLKSLSKLSHHKITELIVFSGLVYTSSDNGLLKVFKVMVSRPATVSTSFLPTMPQSNYFDVKDVMGQERSHHTTPKLYMCPNNHPYYIGECTNPVQAGQCPECGKKIGGQTYGLLHEGNTVGDLTEESQAGYLLKPAEKRSEPIPERTLTKMSVCATRACVHLALLHGSRNGNDVQKVLKLKNPKDVCPFLMNQLVKDLRQLAHCTGKSFDDAILLLQHIFQNMRIYNEQGGGRELKIDRMTARKQWEEAFQREFLSLVFRDTDIIINTAQQAVIDAAKQMQNPLQRMIHEHTMDMTLPEGPVKWTCPQLWKYRTHITVQHLRLKLEAVDGKAEGAVLKLILNTEHLSEIKHLATIFNVQSAFIARYRQRVDIADTDENTIREFLDDGHQHMKEEIFKYIKVWNTVRGNLAAFDKYNTLRKHLEEKMTMDSPISMCLPSDRGRGCCALVLAEYLIEKQNEVLAKCRETMIEKTQFRQIDVSGVAPNNLICISENHDLLPLILANAQYEATTAEGGAKHNIVYNLDLLERKVTEQFILRRCFIKKETLPRMTYLQDVGLGKICIAMQTKFEQVPLPQKICQAVDTSAYNARTADICEAVRTITLIIQFLAKIGGELEQSICDYAERDLLLTNDETAMIPRSAKICHCLALFERFSWHRTLRAIENGQNPFELVSTETGEKMDGVLTQQLNDMLKQFNIERLQNELNALMMVGPELQSDWGLGEILQVYIDGKSENPDSTWCEKIPENICIKHTQHVFALSVKHSVKA
uniref:E3 ubiquitin-protein ligase RNF213-like n=1 Tax=Phallusia mammillata TaxID=59560 RepID=A0A6F9DQC6_9ASCI|nr:E3 ubiquitin-protein ligase RNF213-like [Phallusia mammillata]